MNAFSDPYNLNGEHPADRVFNAQAITSAVYLHGDPPPTRNQVAAVMHALADFTHQNHMLSDAVTDLGNDREHLGDKWAQADGLGRYFHALGDHLDGLFAGVSETGSTPPARTIDDVYTQFLANPPPRTRISADDAEIVQRTAHEITCRTEAGKQAFLLSSIITSECARGIRCAVCLKTNNPDCAEQC